MAQFYDQENPRTSYSSNSHSREKNSSEKARKDCDDLVRRSTTSTAPRERAKVVKGKKNNKGFKKRLTTLLVACLVLGGISTAAIGEIAENIEENIIVYEETSEFARSVIYPNTHRTQNKQYFYYDYSDIASALEADGKDFSTELYKAYSYLGEYQTDRVMTYTDYDSVANYVEQSGFKDIDEWKESERKKIVLRSELEKMHKELNANEVLGASESNLAGGK